MTINIQIRLDPYWRSCFCVLVKLVSRMTVPYCIACIVDTQCPASNRPIAKLISPFLHLQLHFADRSATVHQIFIDIRLDFFWERIYMASTRVHNYYAILGIPQSADSATIKSKYKRLALAQHPDRRRNEPSATADFQLVSLTFSFLSVRYL